MPYKLYAPDCDPPHHDDWSVLSGERHLLNSAFNGTIPDPLHPGQFLPPQPVRMRFYGPVRTLAPTTEEPVTVWVWLEGQQWADVTRVVQVTVKRGAESGWSREITIAHRPGAADLAPGPTLSSPYATRRRRTGCSATA